MKTLDLEPRLGNLILHDGYFGIVTCVGQTNVSVFLGNGLTVVVDKKEVAVLPLSKDAESPADFHEIIMENTGG